MTKLTREIIEYRTKETNVIRVRQLNCVGWCIDDISILENLINVQIISLSVNNICNLNPLQYCLKLEKLFLRQNNISDIQEIFHLRNLPVLRELSLKDNPCCNTENYRLIVLQYLPKLQILDEIKVMPSEIKAAQEQLEEQQRLENEKEQQRQQQMEAEQQKAKEEQQKAEEEQKKAEKEQQNADVVQQNADEVQQNAEVEQKNAEEELQKQEQEKAQQLAAIKQNKDLSAALDLANRMDLDSCRLLVKTVHDRVIELADQ